MADAPAAYLLYEWHGRSLSLFVTAPLAGARSEGAERIIDGVEVYAARLSGVTRWWEDTGLYTAASINHMTHVEEFARLCVRSPRRTTSWHQGSELSGG